jgi:histidinol phosphatase-like PHP family hydrolase
MNQPDAACDYHVHYHLDPCAHAEMTVPNIVAEARRLGLVEIGILKHYSRELPNGQEAWVFWKKIIAAQFETFLAEFGACSNEPGLRIFKGVETELVDDRGAVNISPADANRLDMLVLSVHWLPRMEVAQADPGLIPTDKFDESPPDLIADWQRQIAACGPAALVENLVSAYVRAIAGNPRLGILGHLYDGLLPLRRYRVPVDDLSDSRLNELMEPLMRACAESGVLWELTPEPVTRPSILMRAQEMGVRFCATADAHFAQTPGWANLWNHERAETYLTQLGLRRGTLRNVAR